MNSKISKFLFLFFISVSLIGYAADGNKNDSKGLNKPQGNPVRTFLNINNLLTQIYNDGNSDITPDGNSGVVFPKGSNKTAVFQSGLLWGAQVAGDPQVRVGGSAYRQGLQPGKIISPGVAENPALDKNRIYRVRPDIYPGGPAVDLSGAATDEGQSESAIRAQYEKDWNEWPATDGAPFVDNNNNGTYQPTVDIPGVKGADQTVWFVANDLDVSKTTFMYGANPLGIEMQATIWAYAQTGALGNMFFRKYKIINKSNITFDSMYVSMWSDVDLGNSTDDFAGCDTTLSLGYCYNANANDDTYKPLPPPAVGFDFFQGPLLTGVAGQDRNKNDVDDADDFGIFNGRLVGPGKINLPMTAFYYFARGDAAVVDPTQGAPQGSTQFYNFFQGKIGLTGASFVDPNTLKPTTYALTGDPQTRSGWIDGQLIPAGDRRIGSASGPFQMSPGDTQEVVVAEICAGAIPGTDRLSAIGLLKFYDQQAQLAYDNFFDLPVAPPAPEVKVIELNNEIVLNWGDNYSKVNNTESSDSKGYKFQGYNVYQLPSASADVTSGKRIATFDVVDGIGKIEDFFFDPNTGVVARGVRQFGNDTGIKRFLSIKNDELKGGTPLINGIRYYFAVTSYSYNEDPLAVPNNLENPLIILTTIPHSSDPGVTYGQGTGSELKITHNGTADGGPTVNIVDPTSTTGHNYEIYFSQRQEIRNPAGDWVAASIVERNLTPNHPDTLTGSSIDISAVYGATGADVELHCVLNIESADGDWADGISMTLPAGVKIIRVPKFNALNTTAVNGGVINPVVVGNTIILGDTTHPYTTNGAFEGGEEWIIYVQPFTAPVSVDWKIFDDGYGGGPVDAEGTTTVNQISTLSRLAKYWNLKDVSTNTVKLERQSVIAGTDIFPRRDNIPTNPGLDASPIVDGFQVNVDVGYDAPINFFNVSLKTNSGTVLTQSSSTSTLDIQNYTIFGGTISSKAIDNFGAGTNDINELQKDYELRFTGVWGDTVINGRNIKYIKSGGQMATIFSTVNAAAGLASHPMNPSPGTAQPFLIRIPFEVWCKDDNRQVNLRFRDRQQAATADPYWAWNPVNRMYAVIVNSAYDPAAITPANSSATWVLVFYGTNYHVGDIVTISYANPIQIGSDTYSFKSISPAFSTDLAKQDIEKINVFPNPYYGANSEELNKYNRFVTFSHLPAKANIRIFNLAGVMVREIEKNSTSQFERWDLANNSGLPVASGLYIAYIDMPDIGKTKILKLAIIQEQQILDRF